MSPQSNSAKKKHCSPFLRLHNCKLLSAGLFRHMKSTSANLWHCELVQQPNSAIWRRCFFPREKCIKGQHWNQFLMSSKHTSYTAVCNCRMHKKDQRTPVILCEARCSCSQHSLLVCRIINVPAEPALPVMCRVGITVSLFQTLLENNSLDAENHEVISEVSVFEGGWVCTIALLRLLLKHDWGKYSGMSSLDGGQYGRITGSITSWLPIMAILMVMAQILDGLKAKMVGICYSAQHSVIGFS